MFFGSCAPDPKINVESSTQSQQIVIYFMKKQPEGGGAAAEEDESKGEAAGGAAGTGAREGHLLVYLPLDHTVYVYDQDLKYIAEQKLPFPKAISSTFWQKGFSARINRGFLPYYDDNNRLVENEYLLWHLEPDNSVHIWHMRLPEFFKVEPQNDGGYKVTNNSSKELKINVKTKVK